MVALKKAKLRWEICLRELHKVAVEGLAEQLDRGVLRLACRQPCRTHVALVQSTNTISDHLCNHHPYGACFDEHRKKAYNSMMITMMMIMLTMMMITMMMMMM